MTEQSDARKQAALHILISSGQFTPQQCETLANAIEAVVDLFRQQIRELAQAQLQDLTTSDTKSHT
jgi:diacylglycerol kinase